MAQSAPTAAQPFPTALTEPKPKRGLRSGGNPFRYEAWMGTLFVSPAIILFIIFVLLPAVLAFYLSLTDYNVLRPPQFIGVENYQRLANDSLFFISLRNVLVYVVMFVPTMIIISLCMALALNRRVPGVAVFRLLFFIPVITSPIAAATIWKWVLHKDFGLLNRFLDLFGIQGPTWLFDTQWVMFAVVLVTLWQGVGSNMVVYLAGLQGIPDYLYESAKLDGASSLQRFVYITWPSLRTTTFFVVTLSLVGAFQLFDQAYALTNNGVGNATRTPVFHIYQRGFERLQMGYASSAAFVLFIIIFMITIINLRVNRNQIEELG